MDEFVGTKREMVGGCRSERQCDEIIANARARLAHSAAERQRYAKLASREKNVLLKCSALYLATSHSEVCEQQQSRIDKYQRIYEELIVFKHNRHVDQVIAGWGSSKN